MTQAEKNVITELARQLGELVGRFDEQEKSRNDARVQDREWRVEQSAKMTQIRQDVNDVKLSLATIPAMVDDKLEACRDDCRDETKDAVCDAAKRRTLSGVFVDWRTWVLAVVGVAEAVFFIAKPF